jgi:hypothetical protein
MNPVISRVQVHHLSEQCSNAPEEFQSIAPRLLKKQRRLSRFFEQNAEPLGMVAGQVALYMLSVCLRVVDQVGGRMYKVNSTHIEAATARVNDALGGIFPADDGFFERASKHADRAQSHLLDEVLWALYERPEEDAEQAHLEDHQKALIYVLLWTAVEAMDMVWQAPADWDPNSFEAPEAAAE